MERRLLTHAELMAKVAAIDPLLIRAMDDVDNTLLEDFAAMSMAERIEWASATAQDLQQLKKV